jgi:hypothetical protein
MDIDGGGGGKASEAQASVPPIRYRKIKIKTRRIYRKIINANV